MDRRSYAFVVCVSSLDSISLDGISCATSSDDRPAHAVTLTAHRAPGRGGRARVAVGLGSQVVSVDVDPGCGGRNSDTAPRAIVDVRWSAHTARALEVHL